MNSRDKLSRIEKELHFSLPEIYKRFYDRCSYSIPVNLVGTDWNTYKVNLNEGAVELLKDDGADNFLESDDFVFMMHQGYMFWYFKSNGDPDPIVYAYKENNLFPEERERFSEFIKQFF